MNDLKQSLMQDEILVCHMRPHWIIFNKAAMWLLLAVLIFFISAMYPIGQFRLFSGLPPLYKLVPLIFVIVAIIVGVPAYIKYISTSFIITNKRVLLKKGLILRKTGEILLPRIESVSIFQSLFGRICNYGDILINGTGGSTDLFQRLPEPFKLRNIIQEQIEKK
jgi:uncharacterized membrane protein YdbT with pleckstrin-like domain